MILRIFLSIWALAYVTMIAADNAPCDNSLRKAFLFLSSYLWGAALLAFIWAKFLS